MAFTFRQLFNPDTQGGGGVDSERGAKEKIDKLDDIKEMEEKYSSVNIDTGEDKEDDGTYTFIGDRGDYELDKAAAARPDIDTHLAGGLTAWRAAGLPVVAG